MLLIFWMHLKRCILIEILSVITQSQMEMSAVKSFFSVSHQVVSTFGYVLCAVCTYSVVIILCAGVGGVNGGTSANGLTAGSVTSSAVNEQLYPPGEEKRVLETAAFEERRSMQPIGTERMNKKPRTTGGLVVAPHGTQGFPFMAPTNILPPWAASSMCECLLLVEFEW